MDADPEGTDAERLGQRAHRRPPDVEVGEDGAAEILVEGVDVGLADGVVEGDLSFVTVQLHPDPSQVTQRHLRTRRVGRSARHVVLPGQAVDVPEAGASIVVEGPVGVTAWPGHPHLPVRDAAQVHLPGVEAGGEAAGAQDAGRWGEALGVRHQLLVAPVGDAGEVLRHRDPARRRVGVKAEGDCGGDMSVRSLDCLRNELISDGALVLGAGEAPPRVLCSALGPSLQEGHGGAGACPEQGSEAGEGAGEQVWWGAAEGAGAL